MNGLYLKAREYRKLASKSLEQARKNGARGVYERASERLGKRFFLDEEHFWYELRLREERPRPELPHEILLKRRGVEDLHLLETLPMMQTLAEAQKRLSEGHELWIASEGEVGAFSCWVFRGSMPVVAAPNGRVLMPPEIVCIEDSVASPAYRRRNIAGGVISRVADSVLESGPKFMVTKVETSNIPSQRLVAKVGFREFALVHYRRRGFREATAVRTVSGEVSDWLSGQLTG